MSDVMPAGPELDALVAEKVMGEPKPTANVPHGVLAGFTEESSEAGNWIGTTSGYSSGDFPVWIPKPFSTDPGHAWTVVEELSETPGPNGDHYMVAVFARSGLISVMIDGGVGQKGYAQADTFPHAICLAALKLVENVEAWEAEASDG